MKIYTRGGDRGETSLFGGRRVPKNDPLIDAYGTVDELNAHLGMARSMWPLPVIDETLKGVQNDLFDIGAQLASPGDERFPGAGADRVAALEAAIDHLDAQLDPLRNFILPGGAPLASQLHIARTVCRRAERLVVAANDGTPATTMSITYLNRLSDYLFVAARFANREVGIADVEWTRK